MQIFGRRSRHEGIWLLAGVSAMLAIVTVAQQNPPPPPPKTRPPARTQVRQSTPPLQQGANSSGMQASRPGQNTPGTQGRQPEPQRFGYPRVQQQTTNPHQHPPNSVQGRSSVPRAPAIPTGARTPTAFEWWESGARSRGQRSHRESAGSRDRVSRPECLCPLWYRRSGKPYTDKS